MKYIFDNIQKYGIKELKDDLTLEILKEKFPWILDTKIKNAVLGIEKNCLVWHNGVWCNGYWKYGKWYYGTWFGGLWYNGIWNDGIWKSGVWINGEWLNGTWEGGIWLRGRWHCGIYKKNNKNIKYEK